MENIKFSSFTTETNPANVDFLVGYEGTTMKKIDSCDCACIHVAWKISNLINVLKKNTKEREPWFSTSQVYLDKDSKQQAL